jgi:hypothetical protein
MSASLLEPRLENYTLPYLYLHPDLCTFDTCPLNYGFILYIPSLGANAFFLSLFSLFIFVQVYLGIRYRTIGFTTAMFIGIALETIGYVARIQMHSNTFLKSHFLMYLICLTIGPVFIAAAIYLCLSRIVIVFDPLEKITLLRARSYMLIFCTCDFLSLILQAVGGAIASTATDHPMVSTSLSFPGSGLANRAKGKITDH